MSPDKRERENFEATFGEPPPIITPVDLHSKLVSLTVRLDETNRHLTTVSVLLFWIAMCSVALVAKAFGIF